MLKQHSSNQEIDAKTIQSIKVLQVPTTPPPPAPTLEGIVETTDKTGRNKMSSIYVLENIKLYLHTDKNRSFPIVYSGVSYGFFQIQTTCV